MKSTQRICLLAALGEVMNVRTWDCSGSVQWFQPSAALIHKDVLINDLTEAFISITARVLPDGEPSPAVVTLLD